MKINPSVLTLIIAIIGLCSQKTSAQSLERLFYSEYYKSVEIGMYEGAKKHAIYTYIIGNASTPGLDLIGLLPPSDQEIINETLPIESDADTRKTAILEYVLAQMSINNRRTTTLATIWGNKAKSLKSLATLGK